MDAQFPRELSGAGPLLASRASVLRARPPHWICIILQGLARQNNPYPVMGPCSKHSAGQQRPSTGYGHIQGTSMAPKRINLKGLLTSTCPDRENPTSHN